MKKFNLLLTVMLLVAFCAGAQAANVLYDDTHGQTAGNADWVPRRLL